MRATGPTSPGRGWPCWCCSRPSSWSWRRRSAACSRSGSSSRPCSWARGPWSCSPARAATAWLVLGAPGPAAAYSRGVTDLRAVECRRRPLALVATRELTARQVTDAAIERIEAENPRLNAISQRLDDRARAEADARDAQQAAGGELGPLHGVPLVIKEELAVEGLVTTFGGDANSVPAAADCGVVARLRGAGAVVVATSDDAGVRRLPLHRVRLARLHPQPLGRRAARPAARAAVRRPRWRAAWCRSGLGGDGGGSIRIPSACCGLFGLKPQRGRVTSAPHEHLWFALGTAGPLTRTVLDSALVYDAIRGSSPATGGTRGRPARSSRPPSVSPAGCGSAGRRSQSPSASGRTRSTCRGRRGHCAAAGRPRPRRPRGRPEVPRPDGRLRAAVLRRASAPRPT